MKKKKMMTMKKKKTMMKTPKPTPTTPPDTPDVACADTPTLQEELETLKASSELENLAHTATKTELDEVNREIADVHEVHLEGQREGLEKAKVKLESLVGSSSNYVGKGHCLAANHQPYGKCTAFNVDTELECEAVAASKVPKAVGWNYIPSNRACFVAVLREEDCPGPFMYQKGNSFTSPTGYPAYSNGLGESNCWSLEQPFNAPVVVMRDRVAAKWEQVDEVVAQIEGTPLPYDVIVVGNKRVAVLRDLVRSVEDATIMAESVGMFEPEVQKETLFEFAARVGAYDNLSIPAATYNSDLYCYLMNGKLVTNSPYYQG